MSWGTLITFFSPQEYIPLALPCLLDAKESAVWYTAALQGWKSLTAHKLQPWCAETAQRGPSMGYADSALTPYVHSTHVTSYWCYRYRVRCSPGAPPEITVSSKRWYSQSFSGGLLIRGMPCTISSFWTAANTIVSCTGSSSTWRTYNNLTLYYTEMK